MSGERHHFMAGGGECGALARSIDWATTPLGPVESWPRSLQTMVAAILQSRHPMFLWWGDALVQFYNDGYVPSFGQGKHPAAMGQRGAECWQEIWPIIYPQIEDVMQHGRASWNDDALIPIYRNGRMEEVYWTYGYSPVLDDEGRIAGTLVICAETTAREVSERRLELFRALTVPLADADDDVDVLHITAGFLAKATRDIPLALFLADGTQILAVGLDNEGVASIKRDLLGPRDHTGRITLSSPRVMAPWPEPVREAYVLTLDPSSTEAVVFGLNPRLAFDEAYRGFLQQVGDHVLHARFRARVECERRVLLEEADAAIRAKDEFLAMLGHELRNPLAPIITAIELMKRKEDHPQREREIIERQAKHLVQLVDDLLDVARLVQGKIEIRKVRIPLAEVIARAVEAASPLYERRRHTLHIDVPTDGLDVDADLDRLAQVVTNLLTNAARYTHPGGHVSITASRVADDAVVKVVDNGVGIAPEQLRHLFDAFFQPGRRQHPSDGGLGLGLALVKSLSTLHGGTVSAHSEGLGHGSEFTLRIPLAQLTTSSTESRSAERPDGAMRVLLVDDNEDAVEICALFLETFGFDVRTAHDGPTAIDLVTSFRPAVAVLDIGLPVMDGYELAARLRERMGAAPLRLIAMTGYGQPKDRARSREAGFDVHMVKPVDVNALVAAITEANPTGSQS